MIVVRDVFKLKYGQAKPAIAIMKEAREMFKKGGYPIERLMTDLTGEYYTLVMESSYKSLADYEASLKREMNDPAWQPLYERFKQLVQSGYREIFTVVD